MYLQSLELSGFKSFAKKASLQFTSSITGIVGPNGSGKSNVAEAFRFVLGEQSIKSLRGKRGEDLIWNGGGEASRSNRASVRLIFDNSRRMFPTIDFDEVSIERAVNRDNSNEYIVNGSQVRLKDIIELLAGAHIGATGHHIISQGEADRILSASIRERREMIEDALGLKTYQWKKTESIHKLERTEENMKQVESLRREIVPHLKFLKKQVEKIEKCEEMRRELVGLYHEYFASEDSYIRTEKGRLTADLIEPKRELSELDSALERAKAVLSNSKNKDEKSHELIVLESKISTVRSERDSVTRELGKIEGEISANKRAIEKEKEKMKREESQTVYLKDVEEVVNSVESFRAIDDVKKLFEEVLKILRDFITRHRSKSDSYFIADTENEISGLLKEKTWLEQKLGLTADAEADLIRKREELRQNIESEKDTNREAEKDVFKIIARQNEVRNAISDLVGKLNVVLRDEENFKRELGEAGIIAGREAVDFNSKGGGTIQSTAMNGEEVRLNVHSVQDSEDGNGRVSEGNEQQPIHGNVQNTDIIKIDRNVQEERRKRIEKIKIRLEDAGAGGGAEIMKEYKETEERDVFLGRELEDLEKAEKELQVLIAELDTRIDFEFKSGILKINDEFQRYFTMMFGGGKAELIVVKEVKKRVKSDLAELGEALSDGPIYSNDDEENSQEEQLPDGFDVNVSLPRKKVKGLMMLSGGERALTSIALLFAISQVNPPPFIILDETDAALDEANSKKYGDMIESLSKRSQLILITHNRETMSHAGVLYGVTMGNDGASRLLSIAFEEAVIVAK